MKNKLFTLPASLLLVSLACFFIQSCVKDNCTSSYTYWAPVYKTMAETRANIKNNPSQAIQKPGKIYIRGNHIFLNEVDKGIHIIDNSNPSAPRNIAFVNIPGNLDMAVKGNILYADFYTDLVAMDISDPLHIVVTKYTEKVFPERQWGNGFSPNPAMVIVDWIRRDTTVATSCGGNNSFINTRKSADVLFINSSTQSGSGTNASASPFGVGGSMARFTIVNNHLYAVSETSLNVISILDGPNPVFNNRVNIGMGIETIYPFNNRLFIGSTTGMFIFDIANATNPVQVGTFSHARKCDPVIADNNNAFVTLRSGNSTCGGNGNQLDVLDITTITNPKLVKTYPMDNPFGLSKDGNTLIICDGVAGLKFYNAADVNNINLLKTINGIEPFDVIALNGWALVVAKDGLYQYDYNSLSNVKLLSKLTLN